MQKNWRKNRIASLKRACRNLQASGGRHSTALIAGHKAHIAKLQGKRTDTLGNNYPKLDLPTFQSIIFDTLKFFTCFFFFLDYLVYFLPVLIVTICKKHTKAEAAEFARQYKEYCKEQEAVDKEYCKEQEGIK